MTDVFSARKRSDIMSRVRGRGNKATEIAMVALFNRHGIKGWRRHVAVFGRPDFVFPKHRLAVFVDGCFWHVCPLHRTPPASNRGFWRAKLARNKARDRLVNRTLKQKGWGVLRAWQHELARRNEQVLARRIRGALGLP
jgi:DNA mismatch endonuclease, patch repair protein